MLYQLSYFRNFSGQRWIRTTEGVSQQIYSLPHLATLVFALTTTYAVFFFRASCRIRTNDPEITNHVLWPTELKRLLILAVSPSISETAANLDIYFESQKFL